MRRHNKSSANNQLKIQLQERLSKYNSLVRTGEFAKAKAFLEQHADDERFQLAVDLQGSVMAGLKSAEKKNKRH